MERWMCPDGQYNVSSNERATDGTPMLMKKQKDTRIHWAIKHKKGDWSRTIFTDETFYQLFRNTIRRWSKYPKAETKIIDRRLWYGAISTSRVLSAIIHS